MSIAVRGEYDTAPAPRVKTGADSDSYETISLGSTFSRLWARKWLILGAALLVGGGAFITAYEIPREYESTVTFAPISEDATSGRLGGLSSLVGSLGGLASVAGLSLGGSECKSEYLAILQSESLTEEFIKQNNLLPELFHNKWDAANQRWQPMAVEKLPTPWKGNEFFKKSVRKVVIDPKSGLVNLTITWRDPKTAASWANQLVELANSTIRGHTIAESERNIAYLNDQLTKSTMVAVQNSLSSLLESEIKKVMLAKGNNEYAFRVLDVATPPERASYPNRRVWTLLGAILGGVIVSIFVLSQPPRAGAPRST